MELNIDMTIKRVYHIDNIKFDYASNFGAVFMVKCEDKQAYIEIEYVKLFGEFEDTCFNIKEYKEFNLLDIVNYLIERQNRYILDKIVLALNNNECQVLKLDVYSE